MEYVWVLILNIDMRSQENMTEVSEKDSVHIINPVSSINYPHYNLDTLSKAQNPNQSQGLFTDDQFRLSSSKETDTIKIKRLSEIYPHNISLFRDLKTGNELVHPTLKANNLWTPTYLSEINMLPFRHWNKLIQPPYINQKGFYYVVVCRDGLLTKEIIDDKFYYDEKDKKIVTHPALSDWPWVQIIIKMWAKLNKGYENLKYCRSFSFIRAFSFPDWEVMNPNKERKQTIISKLTKATNQLQYLIAKTKDDPKVGYFGFAADCASYSIAGHYQEFGDIYIKIVSHTLGGWNSISSREGSHRPEQEQVLGQNEYLMPIQQFLNLFHLIYSTNSKYGSPKVHSINYQKYNINIDALSKNAVMIGLEVQADNMRNSIENIQVAVSFYFPHVKIFDLVKNEHEKSQLSKLVVPWSKIMIGRAEDSSLHDSYHMEVMKEGLITYNSEGLMSFNIHKNNHEYLLGNYFKGYANEITYSLSLRPGKYYIRLKIEQIISEYHCFATSVATNGMSKFYNPCLKHEEEVSFLEDCLFRKAIADKKNVTFINPAKRGSWISCRDEKQTLGYYYIAVHVVKNADNKIIFRVNPNILKQNGYIVKQHKDMKNFQLTIDSEENTLIIFRDDKDWKGTGKRIWPPPGIQFRKILRETKNSRLSEKI